MLYRSTFIALCVFLFIGQISHSSIEFIDPPENPAHIVGTLYTTAQQSPTIEDVTSWGSYLYLSVRYTNGDQKLEVWDVRDPAHPVLSDSLDFGNLITQPTDHWKFPSVNVFDDKIVVRSNFQDYVYYHAPDGELVQSGSHDFASSVGEMKNNEESLYMSSASSYGTFFGRLFDPGEVLPEEEYGYAILNFTNPGNPFYSTLVPPSSTEIMRQQFGGHLTGSLGNNPAVIHTNGNQISINARKVKADSHIDLFWEPHIPEIFNMDTLDRTVRSQIDHIIQQQSSTDMLSSVIDQFFNTLEIDNNQTIADSISSGYELNDELSSIFEDYDIDWDQSVRVAIEKVISYHLTLDLEKQLSKELFGPALSAWTDNLFLLSTDGSRADLQTSITDILNNGLSEETVARFILDKFIAPYVDVPDWMYWTMNDVVDQIAESVPGEIITFTMQAANEMVNGDDFLETALAFIPPAQKFYLPAGFPEDCRDVLEYAFFEHGAKLQREGLAFMEMLKFYQYYSGNDSYLDFNQQLADAVALLQDELSNAVVETIEPFLSSLSFIGDIQERLQAFSSGFSCKQTISLAIRDAVIARLVDAEIDVDMSLRDVLKEHRLYLDWVDIGGDTGAGLARVDDFIQVLQNDLNESQTSIRSLWDEGKNYANHIENACRKVLAESLHEAWGELDLDQPMKSSLRDFIGNHVDYRWTFGQGMDNLLKDYAFSCLSDYPPFLDNLGLLKRAEDGDVIARWQITFKIAKMIAGTNPVTMDKALTYEFVETTLEGAYEQAITNIIKALLMDFAMVMMDDMFGSFSTWATRTDPQSFTFNADELTSLNSVRNESFVWKNQAGLVARESWDYLHARKLSLTLFNPDNPIESKQEVIFDGWGGVDYIHFHQGNVLVCGSMYEGYGVWPTAMLASISKDRVEINRLRTFGLASSEGLTSVNHNAHLVLYGPAGIFIVTNPLTIAPSEQIPDTGIRDWMCY